MLILVRHGRTELNATGRLLGHLDPGLDDLGRRQAAALAVCLGGVDAARLVTSPLLRTRETAAAIGDMLGVEPEIDERWIELDYGDFDGMALRDITAQTWTDWRADLHYSPPNGESLLALSGRVRAALEETAALARDRDVVVVSHVSPIKAAAAWALDVGDEATWRMFLGPASITRIVIGNVNPSLTGFNDIAHLTHLVGT